MSEQDRRSGTNVPSTSLLGIPVSLFVWDGDEAKAKDFASTKYTHVFGGLLHFEQWSEGLGWEHASTCVGGWLLKFNGKVIAHGCELPNTERTCGAAPSGGVSGSVERDFSTIPQDTTRRVRPPSQGANPTEGGSLTHCRHRTFSR